MESSEGITNQMKSQTVVDCEQNMGAHRIGQDGYLEGKHVVKERHGREVRGRVSPWRFRS